MSGLSFFAAAISASPPAVEISLDLAGMAAAVEGYSILGARSRIALSKSLMA
jgi:hypothetical protein